MAKSQCNCCDGYENWLRREEIRHGGVTEEALPHRKRGKKKTRIPKHTHDWVIVFEYHRDWFRNNDQEALSVACKVCGKPDFWVLD